MGLSISDYAKHRGCDRKTVRQAIHAGRISTLKDGTIDPKKADAQWEANTSPSHRRSGAAAAEAVKKRKKGGSKPGLKHSAEASTSAGMKRRLDAAKAEIAEIELARLKGRSIDREAAFAQFYADWNAERDAWVTWPARVAAEIAARAGVDQRLMLSLLEEFVERHLHERSSRDDDRETGRSVN